MDDLDNDGEMEIIYQFPGDSTLRIYNYSLDLLTTASHGSLNELVVGDILNDGTGKIITGSDSGINEFRVYEYSNNTDIE